MKYKLTDTIKIIRKVGGYNKWRTEQFKKGRFNSNSMSAKMHQARLYQEEILAELHRAGIHNNKELSREIKSASLALENVSKELNSNLDFRIYKDYSWNRFIVEMQRKRRPKRGFTASLEQILDSIRDNRDRRGDRLIWHPTEEEQD